VAQYQSLARHKIREIQERGKLPFLVGGTGLYIQAVVYPFEFPDTEGYQVIRNDLRRMWGDGKQEEIYQKLKDIDPASAERIDPHDFRRISRALEVYYLTGRPISSYQRDNKNPLYPMEMVGISYQRAELYRRIEKRVDKMFAEGLIDEVRSILNKGYSKELKPFQTLGYKQVIQYLEGNYDLAEAIAETKKATRRYAKRQLTWFRREQRIKWYLMNNDNNCQSVLDRINGHLCRSMNICVE
jgi:tRNA dimethylallyltransferase